MAFLPAFLRAALQRGTAQTAAPADYDLDYENNKRVLRLNNFDAVRMIVNADGFSSQPYKTLLLFRDGSLFEVQGNMTYTVAALNGYCCMIEPVKEAFKARQFIRARIDAIARNYQGTEFGEEYTILDRNEVTLIASSNGFPHLAQILVLNDRSIAVSKMPLQETLGRMQYEEPQGLAPRYFRDAKIRALRDCLQDTPVSPQQAFVPTIK